MNKNAKNANETGTVVAAKQPVAAEASNTVRKYTRKVAIDINKLKALGLNRKIAKAITQAELASKPNDLQNTNNAEAQLFKQPATRNSNKIPAVNAKAEQDVPKTLKTTTAATETLAKTTTARISRVKNNNKILGTPTKVYETLPSKRLQHAKNIVHNHIRERLKNAESSELDKQPAAVLASSERIQKSSLDVPPIERLARTQPTIAEKPLTPSSLRTEIAAAIETSSGTSDLSSPLTCLSSAVSTPLQSAVVENFNNNKNLNSIKQENFDNEANNFLENDNLETNQIIRSVILQKPAAITDISNKAVDVSSTTPAASATLEKPIVMENKLLTATEKFNLNSISKLSNDAVITPEKQISTISTSAEAEKSATPNQSPKEINAVDYIASLSQFLSQNFTLSEKEKRRLLRKRKCETTTATTQSTENAESLKQEIVADAVIKRRNLTKELDLVNVAESSKIASDKNNKKTDDNEIIIIQTDDNIIKQINSDEIIIVMPFDNEIPAKCEDKNQRNAEKNQETQRLLAQNHKMPLKKRWELAAQQPLTNDAAIADDNDDNDYDDNHFDDNDYADDRRSASPTSLLINKYNNMIALQDTDACEKSTSLRKRTNSINAEEPTKREKSNCQADINDDDDDVLSAFENLLKTEQQELKANAKEIMEAEAAKEAKEAEAEAKEVEAEAKEVEAEAIKETKPKPKTETLEMNLKANEPQATVVVEETAENITEISEAAAEMQEKDEPQAAEVEIAIETAAPQATAVEAAEITVENITEIVEKNVPQAITPADITELVEDGAQTKRKKAKKLIEKISVQLKCADDVANNVELDEDAQHKMAKSLLAKNKKRVRKLTKKRQEEIDRKLEKITMKNKKNKINKQLAIDSKDPEFLTSKTIRNSRNTRGNEKPKNSIKNYFQKDTETVNKNSTNENIKTLIVLKTEVKDLNLTTTAEVKTTPLTGTAKKVGRKPKEDADTIFNPRLLLATTRAQVDTDEVLTAEATAAKPTKGLVQCGLCLAFIKTEKWVQHLTEHYGIGWKVDEEEPINVKARPIVLRTILNFLKIYQIKSLNCRMCSRLYRSALGLLLHIETCGLQLEREKCTICDKYYNKSYLAMHLRTCAAAEISKSTETIADTTLDATTVNKTTSLGRVKRASTIKAEKKLRELGAEIIGAEAEEAKPSILYVPALSDTTKQKWIADIAQLDKAFCVHKQCKFEANNLEAHVKHYNSCKHTRAEGYYCLLCKTSSKYNSEAAAVKHIANKHSKRSSNSGSEFESASSEEQSSSDSGSSDEDCAASETDLETEQNNISKTCRSYAADSTKHSKYKQRLWLPRSDDTQALTNKLWKEFVTANFSIEPLFEFAQAKYKLASDSECEEVLPRELLSMKFKFSQNSQIPAALGAKYNADDCQQLKRFESAHHMNEFFLFLGAAVKRIEWIPLPTCVAEQYLCVSYSQKHRYTRLNNPTICNDCLLVFKIVPALLNKTLPTLELQYAIKIPDGPVHCFNCLPSGGYDELNNRLGLIIVGTAANYLSVYALPINICNEQQAKAQNLLEDLPNFLLINVAPVMQLNRIDAIGKLEDKAQCTAICWSEYKQHNIVLAGFSNGCVGMWDIASEPAIKTTNETSAAAFDDDFDNCNANMQLIAGLRHVRAISYVYTGEQIVRCLALHYDCNNGTRWMSVATLSRKLIVYDIRDLDRPLLMKQFLPIPFVRDIFWSNIWEPVLLGYGNAVPSNCPVGGYNPSNLVYNRTRIDIMNSGVLQVQYDAVNNLHVCGCENGDLIVLSAREITLHYAIPREAKDQARALACMDLFQLNGEPLAQPIARDDVAPENNLYDEHCKEKHAIVFMPMTKPPITKSKAFMSKERRPHPGADSMMRINSLCVNRHQATNGNLLIAAGYENGFVRLIPFKKSSYFK